MARNISIEVQVDEHGAVKAIKAINGQVVDLAETAEKQGPRFGRAMENALGFVVGNAVNRISEALLRIPGAVVQVGRELQSQLSDLEAITGITGADLERLGETAVRESIRTGVAARDQVEAYKLLASNIDISTIGGVAGLEKLASGTVTLAQASKIDLATAANVVAASINQWGLEASESERITNVLAAGAKFGAAEVGDLALSLGQAGTTAALANVSIEETVGALEVLGQNTVKGAEAGTGLRNVLTILQSEAQKLADNGIQGVNVKADGLNKSLSKLTPLLGDTAAMADIFGRENLNVASILIKNAAAVEEMTEKVRDTNTAAEQAAIQQNNLDGALLRLDATLKGIATDTFDEYKDELRDAIDLGISAIQYIREHKDEALLLGQVVGALTIGLGTYVAVTKLHVLWTERAVVWTNAQAAAQKLLNLAMRLNPIGLVIAGLTTAGLLAYRFRASIADLAATFLDLGAVLIRSYRKVADALGFDSLSDSMEQSAKKLEQWAGTWRDYADDVRDASSAKEEHQQQTESNTDTTEDETGALDLNSEAQIKNAEALKKRAAAAAAGREAFNKAHENIKAPEIELDEVELDLGDPLLLEGSIAELEERIQNLRTQLRTEVLSNDERAALSAKIAALDEERKGIEGVKTAEQEKREATEQGIAQTIASANTTIRSARDAANAVVDAVRQIIQAKLAEAIAKSIATFPFPLNLIAAPLAAAGVNTLFNRLLPKFHTGGLVGGNVGREVPIMAQQGEFVVSQAATRNNLGLLQSINSGGGDVLVGEIRALGDRIEQMELRADVRFSEFDNGYRSYQRNVRPLQRG